MADIRKDLTRTAEDLSKVAQDAAYVAVGLGVVGLQKTQVARRELLGQIEKQADVLEGPLSEVRQQVAKAWKEFDRALGKLIERADSTFEPVTDRLPAQAQAAVKQARQTRDQLRNLLAEQIAA